MFNNALENIFKRLKKNNSDPKEIEQIKDLKITLIPVKNGESAEYVEISGMINNTKITLLRITTKLNRNNKEQTVKTEYLGSIIDNGEKTMLSDPEAQEKFESYYKIIEENQKTKPTE
ncbi:MAG: hypothetical protein PHT51_03350 [Patescibacteria group bacterium]|nr:hypothetical protein [Patescibacteria group bacterium]MDD4611208.1 hypothetical protein [Patescibacteria group bacterium]